jgi:hypothetical protein
LVMMRRLKSSWFMDNSFTLFCWRDFDVFRAYISANVVHNWRTKTWKKVWVWIMSKSILKIFAIEKFLIFLDEGKKMESKLISIFRA